MFKHNLAVRIILLTQRYDPGRLRSLSFLIYNLSYVFQFGHFASFQFDKLPLTHWFLAFFNASLAKFAGAVTKLESNSVVGVI